MSFDPLFLHFHTKFHNTYHGNQGHFTPQVEQVKTLWEKTKHYRQTTSTQYYTEMDQLVEKLPPFPQKVGIWVDVLINIERDLWRDYNKQTQEPKKAAMRDLLYETTMIAIRLVPTLAQNGSNGIDDAVTLTYSLSSPVSHFQCKTQLRERQILIPVDAILSIIEKGELAQALRMIQELSPRYKACCDSLYLSLVKAHLDKGELRTSAHVIKQMEEPTLILEAYDMWLVKVSKNNGPEIYTDLIDELLSFTVNKTAF